MSEFRLKSIPGTGIYEKREVIGFPAFRVDSLHHFYNRDIITGYALIDVVTGNYVHIEPTLNELRKWMKAQNLNFPPPKKRRNTKKAARKRVNGVALSKTRSTRKASR